MRLRQARKIEHQKDEPRRRWWTIYSLTTLRRAERRLRQSWVTFRETGVDSVGRKWWRVTDDYFRANRVQSRAIRQAVIVAIRRHESGP